MRVIAGQLRGRRLQAAPGKTVRPTGDRVREALFSMLQSRLGDWAGRRVLDLCAGSGALGIEALSRGAAAGVFVEADRAAAEVVADNLRHCGLAGRARLERVEVRSWLAKAAVDAAAAGGPFDLVLADPPYAAGLYRSVLEGLVPALLTPEAWVVVEHETGATLPDRAGTLRRVDSRRHGRATLAFYRPAAAAGAEPTSAS